MFQMKYKMKLINTELNIDNGFTYHTSDLGRNKIWKY